MNKTNTKKKKNKTLKLNYFSENDIESNSDGMKEKMLTNKKEKLNNNKIKIIKNIILVLILIVLIIFIFYFYKEIKSLKNNSNTSKSIENLINERFGNLTNDLSTFKKENIELKSINKNLEIELQESKDKINNLTLDLENLKLKNKETTKNLLIYQKENNEQNQTLTKYKNEIKNLTANITLLSNENVELKMKNKNIENLISRLNDEYKIDKDKIKKLSSLADELNEKLTFALNKNDKLKNDLEKLQRENKDFKELELVGIDYKESIIKNFEELKLLKIWVSGEKINSIKSMTFKLLYKATMDGDNINTIYRLINESSPIIILFETQNNKRFGAYTEAYLGENIIGGYGRQRDPNAFLFSFDYQKRYLTNAARTGVFYNYYEIDFEKIESINYNLKIKNNFFSAGCDESNSKEAYQPTKCELSGQEHFLPKEVEIYHVIKVFN